MMCSTFSCSPALALRPKLEQIRTRFVDVRPANAGISWWFRSAGDFLFWSQGSENAAWVNVHEIERELSSYLSPDDLVRTRLVVISPQLQALQKDSANALADQIERELNANKFCPEFQRRLLAEATAIIYQERDNNFTALMEWQNKAMWLIFAACLFILILGLAAGHLVLFLAGAAGGLMSRLMRSLQQQNVPVDYGASWTTLFLSPLLGAMGGWFGIALITVLSRPDVGLLGPVFKIVKWGEPLKVGTVAIAFALGFSERLFNSLVEVLEKNALKAGGQQGGLGTPGNIAAGGQLPITGVNAPPASPFAAQPSPPVVQSSSLNTVSSINQAITTALEGNNTKARATVVSFLRALGAPVDDNFASDAVVQQARTMGMKAFQDPEFLRLYVSQAQAIGLI